MPDPSPSTLHLPGRKVLIAATSILALLVAVPVVWAVARDHPAETALKDYFAALQDKDADAALALVADYRRDETPRPEFQTPEALGGDWELTGTDLVSEFGSSATVTAEFSTPEGTQHREYTLESDGPEPDQWKLGNPFVTVTVDAPGIRPGVFDYLQVNGVIVDIRDSEGVLTLFPGVYRFYQDVPGVVDFADTDPTPLFDDQPVAVEPPAATVEPEAVQAVQEEARVRIASCLESSQPRPLACPFGLPDGTDVHTEAGTLDVFATGAEWSIEAYPEITIADFAPGDPESLLMRPVDPESHVSLTALGWGDSGRIEATFTTTCTYDLSVWSLYFKAEEGVVSLAFNDANPAWSVEGPTCDTEP